MNRKHSFAVRCLAMVLALVMILSNANLGLTMRAQAAEETSTLFELIAESKTVGTKELNAILAYADALPKLNDETVKYETAPEDADALLRKGTLAVNAVNGWVPYTYTVGGATKNFGDTYSVAVGEDVTESVVTYKLDLNKDAEVKAALEYVAWLADEAGQQAKALDDVSGLKALTALGMLDYYFTQDLVDAVNDLTLSDVGIDLNAQVDEKVEEILEELVADKLTGDAEVDKEIMDKAREEAREIAMERATEEAEKELASVKAEYVQTIKALLDRMVAPGDYYYTITNSKGKPAYEDYLRIYAMLKEYKKDEGGLPHFYEHGADIINEMGALGKVLFDILGEYDEATGTYANDNIINGLLEKLGYAEDGVDANALAEMANRMTTGSVTLAKYTSYTEIDGTSPMLGDLCAALAKCGTVEEYSTDLCLYTKGFVVLDDSFKFVRITLGETGIPCNTKFDTDTVLTQDDVADILTKIAIDARHYDVDTAAVEALVGTKMTANVELTIPAEPKVYKLDVTSEGKVMFTMEIPGNAESIVLPVEEGHTTTYSMFTPLVGETYVVSYTDATETVITLDEEAMDCLAEGYFRLRIEEDIDHYKDNLVTLVTNMNDKLGREAVVLTEEDGRYTAMSINIAMNELMVIAQEFVMGGMAPVSLNNPENVFISNDGGTPLINIQALINAMMTDKSFTSQKMIAMGQGTENNLLTTTIQVPGYNMAFELNLTTIPEQMATVSKGLNAVKDFFWFNSNDGILDISVDLPEKVYEAYVAAQVASGYMSNDDVALSNAVVMNFVDDYLHYVLDMNIDENTFNNTLEMMHIDKDVSEFYDYYSMLKALFSYSGFNYTISEQNVDFVISGDKEKIELITALMGLNSKDLELGLKLVSDEDITATAVVNLIKKAPAYDALVIEPGKLNDAGKSNKLNVIDMTDNLVAKAPTIGKIASVMLLDDIDGNLNFSGNIILDLNGKTVNGSINVGGKLVIVDSNLATYDGGAVTGSVYANGGAILAGTYGSDVTKFLRDGYIQEANGAVRNAMYYILGNGSDYTYVLNADFYQMCDGYLPSVEAIAVDIATDVAMNVYPRVGQAYNGKTMYALNLDELLNSYLGNGIGGAFDAMMSDLTTYVNVEGVNALANDIIDDLTNLEAMADALNNNGIIGRSYKFTSYPATVRFMHNEESNTMDIGFVANYDYPKNYSIALKIEGENDYYSYAKKLLTAMSEVLYIDAEVKLHQPTWYAESNKLTVGGGAYVDILFDLSKDDNYTRGIAIILAYGNPDRAEALMDSKNCVVQLNKIIGDMTVEEFFTALKAMSRDVTMTEMADAVGYKYSAAEIEELENVYHVIFCGLGKVLEVLDVTGCDTKLSFLADGKADVTFDAYNKVIDASVKGFTGVASLEFARFSFTFKMSTQCSGLMGDVNGDHVVDTDDAAWICYYDAELIGENDLHLCVGDVTGDGVVDSDDAAWICYMDAELIDYSEFPCFNK